MQLADASQDGVPVLCMTGRLDAVSAPAVEQRLLQAARTGPGLVLDLAGVDYTSSAGLRLLLKAAKEAKATGHRFVLAAMRPTVLEVLTVSGFTSIIASYPTRAEAIGAMG